MLEELKAIKACLEQENQRGAISDTLWFSRGETLFDRIDALIEKAQAHADQQLKLAAQAKLDDAQVDRLLGTYIPGGSRAADWFLPHDTAKGLSNVRDVVRAMVGQLDEMRGAHGGAAPGAGQQPEALFWYRPRSDGGYEGPLHNDRIELVRKLSGAWVPLFAGDAAHGIPGDVVQAASRWALAQSLVAGERDCHGRERFVFNALKPAAETIMRGSVSQHFAKAVDEHIAASAGEQGGRA